ncbi:10163_t:CDS:2 [Scutellospora calospora]|uniref:10163_t:CDS:1 n=1 Tax=Scutellospora calospora TaxID=85575 RepID=A0ACA9LMY6_9GLOM|nr:10163_t:CDS:2 [Scutellospora calospora]
MSQQSTVNTLKPVYNLVELELDDYEENELVINIIYDLNIFFQNSNNLQYGAIHRFLSPLWYQDNSGVFIYLPTS